MGIRRRRRKLTTLMSRLDQRVRSVELKPANLLTANQIAAAVESGEALDVPAVLVSGAAPYEWTKIQDAYYYPAKLTSNTEDRVEIYLEADLDNLAKDGRLAVSGIHGTSSFDVDVSSDNFTVLFIDAVDEGGVWEDRASWKHDPTQNQLSGVTITNTYSFKPESLGPATWTTRQRLQTKRAIDSFEITGSTVTLTMNADHKFKVGDVVFVSLLSDQANNDESRIAAGLDGLFYITAVTSNTIEYELEAGVDTPTGTITPTTTTYVFPVARRWAQEGSIWVNNSDNTTYYWDGIRWVEYTPSAEIGKDGDPPAPPTNFTITDTASTSGTTYVPYSKVKLAWTAPTTSASGEELTDLLGYKIKWRTSPTEDWRVHDLIDPDASSYTFAEDARFEQGTTYNFELYAVDSGQQLSTAVTKSHTTASKQGDHTVYPPTDPIPTSRLGTITVTWNGRLKTGASTTINAPADITVLNIYVSTTNGFTPSSSNLAKRVRVFGSDGGFDVLTDLTYGIPYYIRITVANSSGVESAASGQVTAQVQPLVNTDLIANTLTTWPFAGQVVSAGALANGAINASTLFGPNVVVQSAIAANAIGAEEIAAGAVIAGKIGANAVTSFTVAANAITAGKIDTNAVTADTINAGAISAIKISANAITSDKIEAGAITADKLLANFVLTNLIIAGQPTNGDINSPGRIEIRGNNNANPGIVAFKNGGGGAANATFRLYTANGEAYLKDTFIDGDVTLASGGDISLSGTGRITAGSTVITSGVISGGIIRTGSAYPHISLDGGTNSLRGRWSSTVDTTLTAASWGMLAEAFSVSGIATANTYSYNIRGDAFDGKFVRGSIYSTSDARLKTDVYDAPLGLALINQLRPVEYKWVADKRDKKNIGVIAQELKEVLDDQYPDYSEYFVYADGSEKLPSGEAAYGVHYGRFVPVLLNAVKELSEEVQQLKSELQSLKDGK